MGIRVTIDLDADTQKLTNSIQEAVAKGFQGGGAGGLATDPSALAKQIMQPLVPALTKPLVAPPLISAIQAKNQAQMAQFLKNIGFAGIPLLSPGSLLGNLFATRQIFSGLSGPVGQRLLGRVGIGGTAGTAAATAGIMAVLLAVGAAFKALIATVREMMRAFEEARKLYAKSLLSGLGLQFSIGRKNLADVIGVDEKEVFKFGAVMAFLGNKLQFANEIMTRTTPNLTAVSMEFQVLKKNLQAMFFEMANDAAPVILEFTKAISEMVKGVTHGVQLLISTIQNFESFFLMIARTLGVGPVGEQFIKALLRSIGSNMVFPQPQGMMNQLPASPLERMGLIVGGFGTSTNDYARRTAAATEKTAKALDRLLSGSQGAGNFGDPLMNMP